MTPGCSGDDRRRRPVRRLPVIIVAVVMLGTVVGCSSSGDAGDRLQDAAEYVGDVTDLDDEYDDARDAVQGHIDEEREILEGERQDTIDAEQNPGTDTTRFCATADGYQAELSQGTSLDADRRVEIYRDLRTDAPGDAAKILDTAIEQSRLEATAPERADAQRAADEVDDLILRTCH